MTHKQKHSSTGHSRTMQAMVLPEIAQFRLGSNPLKLVELPVPEPGPNEIRVKVSACGVCHTELDEIEGRLTPSKLPIVPGHEIVGIVDKCGADACRFKLGERVGIGWIHHSTGHQDENLDPGFRATGKDVNGGYAEYTTVPDKYAYRVPGEFSDEQAAPLLCAGAIGYRALKLANIKDGDRLGLTGFGASAHLIMQLSHYLYKHTGIYVFARDAATRDFALESGAVWVGNSTDACPAPLHAIIDTTPAWTPIVAALANLQPGGRLVINAIRKEEADKNILLTLNYHEHLWQEKELKSVANITHFDIREFLDVAAVIPIKPKTESYRLVEANQALWELKSNPTRGAKVLLVQD